MEQMEGPTHESAVPPLPEVTSGSERSEARSEALREFQAFGRDVAALRSGEAGFDSELVVAVRKLQDVRQSAEREFSRELGAGRVRDTIARHMDPISARSLPALAQGVERAGTDLDPAFMELQRLLEQLITIEDPEEARRIAAEAREMFGRELAAVEGSIQGAERARREIFEAIGAVSQNAGRGLEGALLERYGVEARGALVTVGGVMQRATGLERDYREKAEGYKQLFDSLLGRMMPGEKK